MRRLALLAFLLGLLTGCMDATGPTDPYACRPGADTVGYVTVPQGVYARRVPVCLTAR